MGCHYNKNLTVFCPCEKCKYKYQCIGECPSFARYVKTDDAEKREVILNDFIKLQGMTA